MKLTSPVFQEGQPIPTLHTGDGKDSSPPLQWSDVPPTTTSLALICDDPDAPRGTWVHWVLFNLLPGTTALPEAVPAQKVLSSRAKQGTNDFRKIGYGGPAPPRGKPHRYFFKLYALDTLLDLKEGATKKDLISAMEGHILSEAQLMGTYQRP
jgi:Raf kinase inhibitor-like YbhB/YbcL family protein